MWNWFSQNNNGWICGWMDGQDDTRRQMDILIWLEWWWRKNLVNKIKPVICLLNIHLTRVGPHDSRQYCQVFMPLGIVKLSPLIITHSADKYVLFKIVNIPAWWWNTNLINKQFTCWFPDELKTHMVDSNDLETVAAAVLKGPVFMI